MRIKSGDYSLFNNNEEYDNDISSTDRDILALDELRKTISRSKKK